MPRNLSSAMQALFSGALTHPAIFVIVPFQGTTLFIWSGNGSFSWAPPGYPPYPFPPQTFLGVGVLGAISEISEVSSVNATGVQPTLSGIDPATLQDALTNLRQSNVAQIYLGAIEAGELVASPMLLYQGLTDQAKVDISADTATVTLMLESRLSDLQRAMGLKFTAQWQEQRYPGDVCLNAVEKLIDVQLFWH